MPKRTRLAAVLAAAALAVTAAVTPAFAEQTAPASHQITSRYDALIPAPLEAKAHGGPGFRLTPGIVVRTEPGSAEARQVAEYLAEEIRPATGFDVPIVDRPTARPHIALLLHGAGKRVGDQGYRLDVTPHRITIRANTSDGLFAGVQTLRQLLPPEFAAGTQQKHTWTVPAGRVVDAPRFEYRGAMLDIARHFHTPDEIKSYIDQIVHYKINYLHLHLTDDQGWRIEIDSWPDLAPVGGGPGTGVDGVGGGYLTKEDYADLVAYAESRHITIVPEIDMPGHTNAALSVYGELNCDGVPVPPRTDTEVGYSSLCIGLETTYRFVEDVIREVAELTPGPYLHIGGDEAHATPEEDYRAFMQRVLPLVEKYGKRAFGWTEVTKAEPPTSVVPQFWHTNRENASLADAVAHGNKVIMSPANKAYLDMKYDQNTPLGLSWAGYIEVKDAYDWDPGSHVTGVGEESVLGVEAPLWSETLRNIDDIEFMAFPRLPAIAELGWSPADSHDWESFRARLAEEGKRWEAEGVDFYRSPQIDW
ncbi:MULTISPECIES: beta-N-acetylhexosaminidase [Thermocrispum]|uniref:beta-N-acetylhexosaminidase n=1 Tax=Thermocrispum agreste TaxID=37925 RepID=A0ABD6FBY2_9PSEU|nr:MULTISPECIES: beta-N-acetylhexosaminidase [Thermocrispum]